jgi:hypothetical protein
MKLSNARKIVLVLFCVSTALHGSHNNLDLIRSTLDPIKDRFPCVIAGVKTFQEGDGGDDETLYYPCTGPVEPVRCATLASRLDLNYLKNTQNDNFSLPDLQFWVAKGIYSHVIRLDKDTSGIQLKELLEDSGNSFLFDGINQWNHAVVIYKYENRSTVEIFLVEKEDESRIGAAFERHSSGRKVATFCLDANATSLSMHRAPTREPSFSLSGINSEKRDLFYLFKMVRTIDLYPAMRRLSLNIKPDAYLLPLPSFKKHEQLFKKHFAALGQNSQLYFVSLQKNGADPKEPETAQCEHQLIRSLDDASKLDHIISFSVNQDTDKRTAKGWPQLITILNEKGQLFVASLWNPVNRFKLIHTYDTEKYDVSEAALSFYGDNISVSHIKERSEGGKKRMGLLSFAPGALLNFFGTQCFAHLIVQAHAVDKAKKEIKRLKKEVCVLEKKNK